MSAAINNLPETGTKLRVGVYSAILAALTFLYFKDTELSGRDLVLFPIIVYAFSVIFLERILYGIKLNIRAGLKNDFTGNIKRCLIKAFGFYCSLTFILFLYWLFPEYHGSFYNRVREFAESLLPSFLFHGTLFEIRQYSPKVHTLVVLFPFIVLFSFPYIYYLDGKMEKPEDNYYKFGMLVLGKIKFNEFDGLGQHLLGWIIKGFFIPLMLNAFIGNVANLRAKNLTDLFSVAFSTERFKDFYDVMTTILFTLDLLGAVVGYTFSLRLFDTHFRSSEPTVFGWIVCLMCYQPFQSTFMKLYLSYNSGDWLGWISDPTIRIFWGYLCLGLLSIYTLATLNFGCRFSNISNRGILTGGLYGLTKHPAYVAKNTYWWLVHVPFAIVSPWHDAIRYCLLLLGVNCVYYMRAKTEERHLSRDADYVKYALYMNEKSKFASLGKKYKFLQYKAPAK